MKIFYRDAHVIAQHADDAVLDPSVYGADIKTLIVPDNTVLERDGPDPELGQPDFRPFKVPTLDLSSAKAQAHLTVKQNIDAVSDSLTRYNPQAEVLSWSAKEAAARIVLADGTLTDTQKILLDAELAAGGESDLKVLAQAIIDKATVFAQLCGTIAGLRTSADSAIEDAKTQESLDATLEGILSKIRQLKSSST